MTESNDSYIVISEFRLSSLALEGVGEVYGADADIETGRIALRIGRRPLAVSLTGLARQQGQKIDDIYGPLLEAYEPWMIQYSVGIQDTGDLRNVARFGLKIRLLGQPTAAVASVFPESSNIHLGEGNVAAEWSGSFSHYRTTNP